MDQPLDTNHELSRLALGDCFSNGERVSRHARDQVLARADNRCQICCSRTQLHVHHIWPRVFGGTAGASNLLALCVDCHRMCHTVNTRQVVFGWFPLRWLRTRARRPAPGHTPAPVRLEEWRYRWWRYTQLANEWWVERINALNRLAHEVIFLDCASGLKTQLFAQTLVAKVTVLIPYGAIARPHDASRSHTTGTAELCALAYAQAAKRLATRLARDDAALGLPIRDTALQLAAVVNNNLAWSTLSRRRYDYALSQYAASMARGIDEHQPQEVLRALVARRGIGLLRLRRQHVVNTSATRHSIHCARALAELRSSIELARRLYDGSDSDHSSFLAEDGSTPGRAQLADSLIRLAEALILEGHYDAAFENLEEARAATTADAGYLNCVIQRIGARLCAYSGDVPGARDGYRAAVLFAETRGLQHQRRSIVRELEQLEAAVAGSTSPRRSEAPGC